MLFAESYYVTDFEVQGNERTDSTLILKTSDLKPGQISDDEISEAIKKIYSLGEFLNVGVEKQGSRITFNVTERKAVRKIFVKGNKAADAEDLSKILSLKENRYLSPVILKQMTIGAELYYQTLGYLDAKINYETEDIGDSQVDLIFLIEEGKKFKVGDIRVLTQGGFDADEVLSELKTTEYKWWSSWLFGTGRLNEAYLEGDRAVIQQYMLNQGYINAQVSEAEIQRDGKRLMVVFNIDEGEQFHVGTLSASGDLLESSEKKTLEVLDLEEGEIFNAGKVREESLAIGDQYADYGYAFANVVPETNIHFEDKIIDLNFNVSKGKKVKVNEVKITGNSKTFDNVIRRELKVDEQETYSRAKAERSEILLKRLGYFDDVSITPENIEGRDDAVDLNVNVKEASTGSFSIGGGYSSGDGALFNSQLSERNFLGTGRSVRINADIGQKRDNLILNLDDRRFLDSYWQVGLEGFRREQIFFDFDRSMTGGGIRFGYPLEELFSEWAEDLDFSVKYQYFGIDIDNVDPLDAAPLVIASEGRSTASGFIPRLIRNTIDNPLNPASGSRQILEVELMGFGGSEDYYLAEFRNDLFVPLFDWGSDQLVFSWRFNVGYGDTSDGDPFPLFRRFFPGGINSVRGFKARTMGPKDVNGNEFGGSKQLINNLELIFPLASSAGMKGVFFYDFGEAFDDDQNMNFGDMREAVGFGLRWSSPMGPLRIEFGKPLDKREGESGFVTLFSFGSPLY